MPIFQTNDAEKDSPKQKRKFLKLALVLDNSMYWNLNLTVADMFRYTALTTNVVDMVCYRRTELKINFLDLNVSSDNNVQITK